MGIYFDEWFNTTRRERIVVLICSGSFCMTIGNINRRFISYVSHGRWDLYDEVFAYTNDVDGMMLHYVMHEYEDSWFADQFIWPELDEYRQTFTTLPMRVTHYE